MNRQTLRRFDDETHQVLQNSIQIYYNNRKLLTELLNELFKTQCCYIKTLFNNEVNDLIKDYSIHKIRKKLGTHKHNNSNNLNEFIIENPALPIIGNIKSGKSCLVNSILRKDIVPVSYDICTRCVIRLTYGKSRKRLEFYNKDGDLIKAKVIHKSKIPEKYVKYPKNDEKDKSDAYNYIYAYVETSFLKCGLDLIDTPGLNKSVLLNEMSLGYLENVLPIIVYVIDGNTGVTESTIANLYELRESYPNSQILYFVTHLDNDDCEDSSDQEKIDASRHQLQLVFQKLQFHNFLPRQNSLQFFHGASLKIFADMKNPVHQFHFTQFANFELNLLRTLSRYFKSNIISISEQLMNFTTELLTKLIDKANNFSSRNKQNMCLINKITEKERVIHEKLNLHINHSKQNLVSQLQHCLTANVNRILDPIQELEYPGTLAVPDSGHVTDPALLAECRKVIMQALVQGLEEVVRHFLQSEFYSEYDQLMQEFSASSSMDSRQRVREKLERSCYSTLLDNKALHIFKPTNTLDTDSSFEFDDMELLNTILGSIKQFLSGLTIPVTSADPQNDVKSTSWKLLQAKSILDGVSHFYLAEKVCHQIHNDINAKHDAFMAAIQQEKLFLNSCLQVNDRKKSVYSKNAPDLFLLFLKVYSIYTSYKMDKIEKYNKKIGMGGEGFVYKCKFRNEEMAVKEIALNKSYDVKSVAEEVYYSVQLSHYRLLPCLGAILDETNQMISIYYELMDRDLYNLLTHMKVTINNRIKFGIQIAEGISYLHEQGVVHRDLKLSNILVDFNNNAHISDYGYCKSKAFIVNYSFVGTPIHIAPEVMERNIYTTKVDIYSFGILLWYLFEGTGRHPANTTVNLRLNLAAFNSNNRTNAQGVRPERLENIPNNMWNQLERCWDRNPENRPDINELLEQLQKFPGSRRMSLLSV